MVKKDIICIVQARYSSYRFLGKILKKINKNLTVLEFLIERLKKSKLISRIVIACSDNPKDAPIIRICKKRNVSCFAGSEKNVLDRYYKANKKYGGKTIIRITSDCPLMDPNLIDNFLEVFLKKKNIDYLSNIFDRSFPDGLDIEIFNKKTLNLAWKESKTSFEQEHVTPFMRKSKLVKKHNIKLKKNFSDNFWGIDYEEDLKLIKSIVRYFSPNIYFPWQEVIKMKKKNKKIFEVNKKKKRTVNIDNNPGQVLWNQAKVVIPGGNMFLSKKPEMFLPHIWPTYFKKSKGCRVQDLKGKYYYDMTMGVGTNVLGYANQEVDNAVRRAIKNGTMSSLNCPEEVYLAKKLIASHKWSGGVKFARTGGEANALALRIARCFVKKTKIAFCGYHGWHDWYLSANLNKKNNLESHLLADLSTVGVPKNLRNTVFPFKYKKFEELKKIVNKHDIGIIVMEFSRNIKPDINFLKRIRKLATKKNIILIFDECTSGFRQCMGGLHNLYKVYPDIATFGKCLGNGYAITAVIGKKNIMDSSRTSFISSTFWSERVGYVAALKTLEIMERKKTWRVITQMGLYARKKLKALSKKHRVKINVWGLPALVGYTVKNDYNNYFKTFITQEMLKNGFIFGNCIYLCINHNRKIIDKYFFILDKILKKISKCKNKTEAQDLLDGPPSYTSFPRLN